MSCSACSRAAIECTPPDALLPSRPISRRLAPLLETERFVEEGRFFLLHEALLCSPRVSQEQIEVKRGSGRETKRWERGEERGALQEGRERHEKDS